MHALENGKIHRVGKNMHGPEASQCSSPDEDSAHVAVRVCKITGKHSKNWGRWDSNPRPLE